MSPSNAKRKQFVIERTLQAPVEKVWKMWTTKEGLEKWWGPVGFSSVVRVLDVRVGGRFEIVMTAFVPAIVELLRARGMGPSSDAKGDYTEVEMNRRLAYTNAIDFVPGLEPYTANTVIEISPDQGGGTRLVVSNDVMHDQTWTEMARQGWTEQIEKLVKLM